MCLVRSKIRVIDKQNEEANIESDEIAIRRAEIDEWESQEWYWVKTNAHAEDTVRILRKSLNVTNYKQIKRVKCNHQCLMRTAYVDQDYDF